MMIRRNIKVNRTRRQLPGDFLALGFFNWFGVMAGFHTVVLLIDFCYCVGVFLN